MTNPQVQEQNCTNFNVYDVEAHKQAFATENFIQNTLFTGQYVIGDFFCVNRA